MGMLDILTMRGIYFQVDGDAGYTNHEGNGLSVDGEAGYTNHEGNTLSS